MQTLRIALTDTLAYWTVVHEDRQPGGTKAADICPGTSNRKKVGMRGPTPCAAHPPSPPA